MTQFLVHGLTSLWCIEGKSIGPSFTLSDAQNWLKTELHNREGVPPSLISLRISNLKSIDSNDDLYIVYSKIPLLGGKGGFGTLLRGGNANKQGPVNTDSSRDLDGRRIRDTAVLTKVKKALDKKQRRLNGEEIISSDEEDSHTHGKKRKRHHKKQHKETPSSSNESNDLKISKYEMKKMMEEKTREIHRQVVAETNDAVLAGLSKMNEKGIPLSNLEFTSTRSKVIIGGDPYAVDSSSESSQDYESEHSSTCSSSYSESDDDEPITGDKILSTPPQIHIDNNPPKISPTQSEAIPNLNETNSSSSQSNPLIHKELDTLIPPNGNGIRRSHGEMESQSQLDLSKYESASQLESVGLDRLKQELGSRGLMVGGTLTERANRLFQVKGLKPEEYPSQLLSKASINAKRPKKS